MHFPLPFIRVTLGALMVGMSSLCSPLAFAQANVTVLTAQNPGLIGACRQVNRETTIYQQRDPNATALMKLRAYEQVVLNEVSPLAGWVAVRWPTPGYISTASLTNCGVFAVAPTAFCFNKKAFLNATDNLPIYSAPNRSNVIDRLYNGERIHVTREADLLNPNNPTQIRWLPISHPIEGAWVEYSDGNRVNFVPCNLQNN